MTAPPVDLPGPSSSREAPVSSDRICAGDSWSAATRCCLDNFSTSTEANIEPLLRSPHFSFRHWDIADPIALFDSSGIFNLACPASPRHYQSDPVRTTMTSVRGTFNLLELARSTHAPFVQASTSEVYGDPAVHPQTESYWGHVNPTGMRSCYDEGKRCAESLCFDYRRTLGVDVRVARIFNTYGPRMQVEDGRVVSNFIVQALRGERSPSTAMARRPARSATSTI